MCLGWKKWGEEEGGGSLNPGQHALSLLGDGMGSVGRVAERKGGGGS